MPRRGRHSLVLTTTATAEEAHGLARGLVEARLAACVQVGSVISHYIWKGATQRTPECLLIVKTRTASVAAVTAWLADHHSYQTPEVLEIPIASGLAPYLAWVDAAVDARAADGGDRQPG